MRILGTTGIALLAAWVADALLQRRVFAAALRAGLDDSNAEVRESSLYALSEIRDSTALSALIEGSILVAIILFLFLGEVRSAVVVIIALPLAMLMAFTLINDARQLF